MAIGDHTGQGQPPSTFGVQPSGPKLLIPRLGAGAKRGRAPVPTSAHIGANTSGVTGLGRLLPSSSTLDYAHKLTSTSLLLIGAAAFLLLGPRSARGKLKALGRKHIGGS